MKTQFPSPWNIRRASLLWVAALALVLVSGCGSPMGPGQAGGPANEAAVWIEFPPAGETFPNQALSFVVYATNEGGAASIELAINGARLPAGQAASVSSDGSSRMARVDTTWQPPAEGQYTLTASSSGASTSVTFCVVTCQPSLPAVTGYTPTPAPGDTATPLPFITLPPELPGTITPGTPSEVTVEFYASPSQVDAGSCATLHWDVSGTEQVYLDGAFVYLRGMQEYCPCESETHTLRVIAPDGSSKDYTARIEAYGSCSAPPTESPPTDTDGPSINWANLVFEGCQFYGQAGVSDPSGVSWAKFYFNKNGEGWKSVWMSEISSDTWQADAGISLQDGIGTPMGTIEYYVTASDTLGNQSEGGGGSYNYTGCGG